MEIEVLKKNDPFCNGNVWMTIESFLHILYDCYQYEMSKHLQIIFALHNVNNMYFQLFVV